MQRSTRNSLGRQPTYPSGGAFCSGALTAERTYAVGTYYLHGNGLTVRAWINEGYGLEIWVPELLRVLDPDWTPFTWTVVTDSPYGEGELMPDPIEPRQLPFTWSLVPDLSREMITCGVIPPGPPDPPPGFIWMPNPYASYNATVFEVTQVPEPSALLIMLGGLASLSAMRRLRRWH